MATFGIQHLVVGLYAVLAFQSAAAQYRPTCRGIDDLIERANLMICTRNEACNMSTCSIVADFINGYMVELTLLSCRKPPALHTVISDPDGEIVLDNDIDQNVTAFDVVGVGTTMYITLNQLDNAIGVGADVKYTFLKIPVIPYSVIPLDICACTNQTTNKNITMTPTLQVTSMILETPQPLCGVEFTAIQETSNPSTTQEVTTIQATTTSSASLVTTFITTTTSEPPKVTPTSTMQMPTETPTTGKTCSPASYDNTCEALVSLAKNAKLLKCVAKAEEPCDQVNCIAKLGGMNYTVDMVLLPCRVPSAVQIVVSYPEKLLANETVDDTKEIAIPGLFELKLNLTLYQFQNAIGLQVDGKFKSTTISVIKCSVIPLDKCKCMDEKQDRDGNNCQNKQTSDGKRLYTSTALPAIAMLGIVAWFRHFV